MEINCEHTCLTVCATKNVGTGTSNSLLQAHHNELSEQSLGHKILKINKRCNTTKIRYHKQ
jgi:hypothetical protein